MYVTYSWVCVREGDSYIHVRGIQLGVCERGRQLYTCTWHTVGTPIKLLRTSKPSHLLVGCCVKSPCV